MTHFGRADGPCVHLWPLGPEQFPMAVAAPPVLGNELGARVRARWAELCAGNSKFFDGPLLTLKALDENSGKMALQRVTYMAYAVQPQVDTGVISVGVTAVACARGADGVHRYLFGQRAGTTHMHPNRWELGPSGALAPPASGELAITDVLAQLRTELSEEIGLSITLDDSNCEPLCTALDLTAMSLDLVMLIRLEHPPAISRNWEYQDCEWISSEEFAAWAESHDVIPPSAAIMQSIRSRATR